ncbi:substrate-binding periplasmic protein [Roseateles sp. BYS78W]|uniref:Substrate-binding periplasmic protein n=1 Tax=Pelomonas candidula TaxID=3299025 RepID=A0ABW7HBZ9_9BURK
MAGWRRRKAGAALLALLAPGLGWAAPLRFATDINDQTGLAPIGRALLRRAFERLGLELQFEPLPLRRSLTMTLQGLLDGESLRIRELALKNPELLLVPVPLATVQVLGYVRQAGPRPRDEAALMTLRVGYPRGVVLLETWLADAPRRVEASTRNDLLRLLRAEVIDVALLTSAAGMPELEPNDMTGLARLPAPLHQTPLYALLHQRHRELLPRLTAVLREMEDSGESARLRSAAWGALLMP